MSYHCLEAFKLYIEVVALLFSEGVTHLLLSWFNKKHKNDVHVLTFGGCKIYLMFVIHVSQARYYVDEVKDKTGKDIDVSTWEKEYVEDLPEQENGFVFWSSANRNIIWSFSLLSFCFSVLKLDICNEKLVIALQHYKLKPVSAPSFVEKRTYSSYLCPKISVAFDLFTQIKKIW